MVCDVILLIVGFAFRLDLFSFTGFDVGHQRLSITGAKGVVGCRHDSIDSDVELMFG